MYNPIDSCYKKAIEICGVKATINNTDTKILIREANDSYGVDYKKIISSQDIKQGDSVFIDGVQYLICDIEDKMSQSVYHVGTFRKCLPIILESNSKEVYSIVDKLKGVYVQGQQITEVHDQYNFIVPKNTCKYTSISTANNIIVYAGGSYDAISIDDSKEGILTITGRFNTTYNPHTYTITLNSNSQTLVETENYSIVASATDNGITVPNPQLTFVSSDPLIATVDSKGIVSASKVGSCDIIVNFNNVSATLTLTVDAKPSIPVVSYNDNWSQPIATTGLKQYVTAVYTVTRSTNGIVENPLIDYTFDIAGQSLISSSKIVVTRKADNSFSVKNTSINTTITCHVSIIDHADGHIIEDNQLLTFIKGI